MEFDEIQKIWDLQTNRPLYAINEEALHNRIISKQKQARHITNLSELMSIIVNIGAGCFIAGVNFHKHSGNIFMYILSAWMFCVGLYLLMSRIRRIKRDGRFDRSMRGDLEQAISMATYQVRLSLLLRWNILPMAILLLLGVWQGGKSVWLVVGLIIFFILANYAAGWEHHIYKGRKRELKALQKKLENEELSDPV